MPSFPRTAVMLAAGSVTVEFIWRGDRWGHRLQAAGVLDWQSVEDCSESSRPSPWPPSPPLVELSRLNTPAGGILMAVGAAGRTHFSASISAVGSSLRFELACRLREPPEWVGSTYESAGARITIRPPEDASRQPFPGTLQWAYLFGPHGFTTIPPGVVDHRAASCGRLPNQSDS